MDVTSCPVYQVFRALAGAQRAAAQAYYSIHYVPVRFVDEASFQGWFIQVADGGVAVTLSRHSKASRAHSLNWEHVAYQHPGCDVFTCWPACQAPPRWVVRPRTLMTTFNNVAECLSRDRDALKYHSWSGAVTRRHLPSFAAAETCAVMQSADAACCMCARLCPGAAFFGSASKFGEISSYTEMMHFMRKLAAW
jgi:hypothetical protein